MRALALDHVTGQILWERAHEVGLPNGAGSNVFLALSGNVAYVAASKGLSAYQLADGALLWRTSDNGDANYFAPVVEQGTIYRSEAIHPRHS